MKNIENIIRENRDQFNDREPVDGHFERFEWKLQRRLHSQTLRRSIVPYLLKAAVVTLLVTLSSLWIWDNFIRSGKDRMALSEVSPQYREVENYYIHQTSIMEDEIKTLYFSDNPEQKKILDKELWSMDSVYVQLQKDLKANPDDERIINAMIEHYQLKLEVLTYILNQLKAIRNENSKTFEYEKTDI
ncbi:MAG: hypothetical protein ACUVTX_04320 [Bacteroidales bacterium]